MSSLGEGIIHFAVDLFQQIRQLEKENIFYSPLSIMSALAMTSLGARGDTASEIQKVLHANAIAENTEGGGAAKDPVERPGNIHHPFQKLLTEFKKPTDAYELNVANRLYGEKTALFLQAYMDNVEKFYLASVESADFVNAAEESRKMINSWVESQTNSRLWESHSFKITVDSPLCVSAVLDTAWGARSRGEMRLQGMEAGTAEGGMVHVSVERKQGEPGRDPRTSYLETQLSLWMTVSLWIPTLCSNFRLIRIFSLN